MPDGIRCQYVLGPCDARSVYLSKGELRGGSVACGGGVYYVEPNTANPVFLHYAPDAERAQEASLPYDPRAVFASWHALMRTLAYGIPAELKRVRVASARLRKAVR